MSTTQIEIADAKTRLETDLNSLIELRPLPEIAMRILKTCQQENANVISLVKLVECDAAVSSRVLAFVNTSMFGYSREVSSINQAVVVLGMKQLSQLAVSVATESVFSEGENAMDARARLYQHSLGCATIGRLLANITGSAVDSSEAFLAGMLHDIGKLVLLDVAPNGYTELQTQYAGNCLVDIEQQVFGIDHAMLGSKLGRIWGLPAQVNHAIASHHCQLEPSRDSLVSITALANELAKHWGVGQDASETCCGVTLRWLESTGFDESKALEIEALENFEELKSLLAT